MASESFVPSSKASSLGSSSGWSKDNGEQMRTAKKNGCQMVPRCTKQRVSCLPVHFTSILSNLSNLSMLSIPSKCGAMMSHVIDPDFLWFFFICKRENVAFLWFLTVSVPSVNTFDTIPCPSGSGSVCMSWSAVEAAAMGAAFTKSPWLLCLDTGWTYPSLTWCQRFGVKLNFLGYQLWTNIETLATLKTVMALPQWMS